MKVETQIRNLDEIIEKVSDYLNSKSITELIVESHLSQSIIYKYRNDRKALENAKFSTIYNLYQYAQKQKDSKKD